MTILQCTSLSKHYGRGEELVKALEGVSLSLEQGSFTAITGPSGSGKSTLLHMLGGLDRPTEGSVQFRDKDLYRLRDDQLAILQSGAGADGDGKHPAAPDAGQAHPG